MNNKVLKLVRKIFHTPGVAALCLLGLGAESAISGGTWTALTNTAPGDIQTMLLLPNGTVMAEDADNWTNWYQLTPDNQGSYLNGTWSTLAPMHYSRLYYSSDVLPDGRVFIAGGEYGNGTTNAEIYDPVANVWTIIPVPSGLVNTNNTSVLGTENDAGFMDSFSVLLSNGKVLITPVVPANFGETVIYDPVANSWATATLVNGYSEDEATGVILPDNSILIVDNGTNTSERYFPSVNQWIGDANVPVSLFDPYGDEEGAAFLLPNGKAFFAGSTPVTALYTPSGTSGPGTWVAGPSIPGNLGQPDAPAAMMVNGKILYALSPTPTSTSNIFTMPTTFYEYDYSVGALGTFTQVSAPGGGNSINNVTFIDRMLDLPDGTVLFTESGTQLYVYTPDLGPLAAGRPGINSVTQNPDGSYLLTGTLLNGISEGAGYGDDVQANSNYPLVRMTNNATGNVYYARTYNWSSTGVMTGSNIVTTKFAVPASAPIGMYSLVVVANGNASAPVSFNFTSPIPVLGVVTNYISGGNPNASGIIGYDGCYNLTIVLTNSGGGAATGVEATLFSTTPGAIVAQSSSGYPELLPGGFGPNLNAFTISTEPTFICGTPINLVMVVKCNQIVQTNYIQLPSGQVGSPDSFTSSTAISIPTTGVPVNSPIVVSGLQAVGDLTVSVYLTAQYDFGLSLELLGPSGTNVILSQNNGFGANFGVGCGAGLETVFDDASSNSIVNGSPPYYPGSFSPQQPLSVYHLMSGTNLNGTWNLQVLDEFPGDTATLECWSLNVSPEVCLDGLGQCPGADLSLTMSASPNPVYINSNLVYTLTVSNAGPSTAGDVLITQTLPPGISFVTTSNYPVTVGQSGSNFNLSLGSLPVYGSATVSVITLVTPATPPGLTPPSTAFVGSAESDPNLNNNSASVSVFVTEPIADLAVSMTGAPAAALQGGLLTYTINVTNNGPFTAFSATNITTLPGNASFISATASDQGTVLAANDSEVVVTWTNLAPGAGAVVTIVTSPTLTGNITANTQVILDSSEVDPDTFNNTASVSTTVGPAADLSVTAFTLPNPALASSNVNYIVTVSNAGPSAATGVVFSQSIPSGSTFVANNLPGITTISNNLINIALSNMASGGATLITNVFKAPTLLSGVKSNLMVSTLSVFGQPGDPNTNNNVITLQTVEEPPTVTIVAAGVRLISTNVNTWVGTTGTYSVDFFLQNLGNVSTVNLVATLQAGSGVTPVNGSNTYTYGALAPEAAPTAGQFSFLSNGTNGGTNYAVLQLQDGSTNLGMATFAFVMPVVQTFLTNNIIFIPNPTNTLGQTNFLEVGQGYPYPSTIIVSNVNGAVAAVTISVSNLTHAFASDVGLLLVGPSNALNANGISCVLMSAAGQDTGISAPVTLTFDQTATSSLPEQYVPITSGTYLPSDYYTSFYGTTEAYTNSPVPLGPYNTNLTVFAGFPANGKWSLYAYDFADGDSGQIANGWSLNITTITPVNLADLATTMVTLTPTAPWGGTITNVWTVTNNGPDASIAYVTNVLPSGLTYVSDILPSGVTTSNSGPTHIYYLGSLLPGASAVVTNVVSTINATNSPQTNTITVGSSVLDTNLVNNTAVTVTVLNPTPVGLTAEMSVSPNTNNPVPINSTLTYTLSVNNSGPSNAFNVVGSFSLSGFLFDPGLSTSGLTLNNGVVQYDFGIIPANDSASVTIAAIATNVGVVTNVWSIASSSTNSNLTGNSVSTVVRVTNAVPIITLASVTLLSHSQYGAIYAGQTNSVSLTLTNIGFGPTTNLWATLIPTKGVTPVTNVTSPSTSNYYGAIPVGDSTTSGSFAFVGTNSGSNTITVVWSLQDGTNFLGNVSNTFVIPLTMSFANLGAISIPDFGEATPYPSEIQVSGLTNLLVSKVTVTLNGFTHSYPHDVEAVLVSPAGQEVFLMEHTGGPYTVSNLVLTFDDAALQSLPANGLITGTFLTTEYPPSDVLPGIAPVPGASTNLAFFNGLNPNGIWLLYVYDDTRGNDGIIANGWSLNLTVADPVNPASRLVVSTIVDTTPVIAGNYLTNQVTVSNLGPDTATGVVLTNILTSSVRTLTTTTNLGMINSNASTIVTITLGPIDIGARGNITNTEIATAVNNTDLYLPDSTNVTITNVSEISAPYLSAVSMAGGELRLTVNGYPGQIYLIQSTTNISSANSWTNVYTNTSPFTFTNTSPNGHQRFYRAVHQPQ